MEVKFFTCVSSTYVILIRGKSKRCYEDLSNKHLFYKILYYFVLKIVRLRIF